MLAIGLLIGITSEQAYQRQQLRELDIQALTLAESVAAAVMFNDSGAAQENAPRACRQSRCRRRCDLRVERGRAGFV